MSHLLQTAHCSILLWEKSPLNTSQIHTCCRRILCIKKTALGTIQKQKEHGAIFTCHPTTFTCHTAHFYPAHNIPCSAFPEGCPIVSMGCTLLCVTAALGGGEQSSRLLPLPYAPAHTHREHKLEVVKTISKLYTYKDNIYTVQVAKYYSNLM